MTTTSPNKITPEEWRTAAKVARRSIFGNSELADAWENVAKYSAAADLPTQLAKAIRAAWVDRLDWDELAQGALEFLTSTGRLIPAGGMALTAEQVDDVRTVSNCALQYGNIASREAAARLDSSLAPAGLAEEETKADPFKALHDVITFSSMDFGSASDVAWMYGIVVGWDNDDADEGEHPHAAMWSIAQRFNWPLRKVEELRNLRAEWVRRTSSPVVPAPTGTEWPTWDVVPENVTVISSFLDHRYRKVSGEVFRVLEDGKRHKVADFTPTDMRSFAPFVAAEEG